jgi:pilus assembly protein CpaE
MERSPVLAIITEPKELDLAISITSAVGYKNVEYIQGSPLDAANFIVTERLHVKYIILFIAGRTFDVLPELDMLAEQCDAGTKLVIIGDVNDISFYRALKERGVVEYFNGNAPVADIRNILFYAGDKTAVNGRVISVIGGGAGDGSSMVALNVASILQQTHKKKVVLIDLDYQFGMVARHLELNHPYSIKEIFDHPDRGVDAILLQRMITIHASGLHVISSPQTLNFMPDIKPELIRDFITHLSAQYEYVILDLPHRWDRWVSSAVSYSEHILLVSQLLLKSIAHSSKLLNAWTELGFTSKAMSVIINRSGSRFKESLHPKDFERIIGVDIKAYLPNDIKTVCQAENKGVFVSDIGKSQLGNELERVARLLL